jgi:hypothetical protein
LPLSWAQPKTGAAISMHLARCWPIDVVCFETAMRQFMTLT